MALYKYLYAWWKLLQSINVVTVHESYGPQSYCGLSILLLPVNVLAPHKNYGPLWPLSIVIATGHTTKVSGNYDRWTRTILFHGVFWLASPLLCNKRFFQPLLTLDTNQCQPSQRRTLANSTPACSGWQRMLWQSPGTILVRFTNQKPGGSSPHIPKKYAYPTPSMKQFLLTQSGVSTTRTQRKNAAFRCQGCPARGPLSWKQLAPWPRATQQPLSPPMYS